MTNSSSPPPIPDRLQRLFPPGTKVNAWDLEATVTKSIHPGRTGQVKFQGTWWNARCKESMILEFDLTVYVVDVDGVILVVQATPPASLSANHQATA